MNRPIVAGKARTMITSKTYDAVLEKFEQWKNGTYKSGNTESAGTGLGGGTSIIYKEDISTVSFNVGSNIKISPFIFQSS